MKKINQNKKEQIAVVGTFVFFVFMMCFKLTHSAPWGDEWVEYNISQYSIKDGSLYAGIVSTFQPPLYNFIMHFWLRINQSVLWFRLMNIFVGIGTGVFTFLAVQKLTSRKIACISLCVLAVTYQWIYCIQECAEYALMLGFLSMALFFFVECMLDFSYARMVGLVLGAVLAIYSQYGAVFVALPLLLIFYVMAITDKKMA